ncbi:MAG TPA: hypothetical protein VFW18_09580 [Gaiellales bacterium]|nr:hypothetical protein [Gaiellales bacterium]
MFFFRLSSLELGLLIFAVIFAATGAGVLLGWRHRHRSETLREPFGALQGALLGVVGLLLAFGLALAVDRGPASGRGDRGQRDRHHLPARAIPG